MKKPVFFLLAILIVFNTAYCQHPTVEMSAGFDEPEAGWNKVMQLSNGNTFFFHSTKKEGIEITVYDKGRNLISTKEITSELWDPTKFKNTTVVGLYEIKGQPVLFLHQMLDRTPTLFRIILDANTGAVVKEKQLGTIERYKAGAAWAMKFGKVEPSDFYVEKDPYSDCYAVVFFNGFAHESGERIKVVHYSGDHKKISSAYYDSPNDKYKYLRFISMVVEGDKMLHICTYGFNDKSNSGEDAGVIISKLNAGDSAFTHKSLDFAEDFRDTKAVMRYNKGTNKIQLLTLSFIKGKRGTNYYLPIVTYIDPETMFMSSAEVLTTKYASEYLQKHLDRDEGFSGLPQDMVINSDNSTTIVMEESAQQVTYDHSGNVVSATTTLGNIGLSELNDKAKEAGGYAILKSQTTHGLINALYQAQREKGYWSIRAGGMVKAGTTVYMSFDYLTSGKNRYVIFNDYPENFDRDEKKKRKMVVAITPANTICYKLHNGEMEKFYLFGEPDDDKKSKFCYIETSDFNKQTNTYATLVVDRDHGDKVAKIAWVKFE